MMKKIALIGTLLISTGTFAHENHFNISTDNCEVSFQNDVRISNDQIIIENQSNRQAILRKDGSLVIDGKAHDLNHHQKQFLTEYNEALRQELPKVATIALDAVKIAGVAINEVASTFNINSLHHMHGMMDEISQEIQTTFYRQDEFVMGEKTFNEFGETFDQKFEARLESAIEKTMTESIGSILVSLGSAMMSSGGNMAEFESRMETLGETIEQRVEAEAKSIEARAEKLCQDFEQVASLETRLSDEIPALSNYKLFSYKNKS
ncbi:hypothetical protein PALB_20850 [Pseudoalteromonas luteoviolacea B = ATCC 29581]|nr:hypothetical protein PALB_20850 [Pseudoalteromonas luteoviolacea B = ATCC 29581]